MNIKPKEVEKQEKSTANFIECHDIKHANLIDMKEYRFLDGLSSSRRTWCFKIRENPVKK